MQHISPFGGWAREILVRIHSHKTMAASGIAVLSVFPYALFTVLLFFPFTTLESRILAIKFIIIIIFKKQQKCLILKLFKVPLSLKHPKCKKKLGLKVQLQIFLAINPILKPEKRVIKNCMTAFHGCMSMKLHIWNWIMNNIFKIPTWLY